MQILSEGQCIKHDQYGFGIVAESDVERTTIDFDSVGTKKFVTSLMSMELVGEAPERPTKPRRRSKKAGAAAAAKLPSVPRNRVAAARRRAPQLQHALPPPANKPALEKSSQPRALR